MTAPKKTPRKKRSDSWDAQIAADATSGALQHALARGGFLDGPTIPLAAVVGSRADYAAERKRRGLTQQQLAALVAVDRVTIAKRESGAPGYPITREAWLALLSLPARGTKRNT